jgi:hypothetical protein
MVKNLGGGECNTPILIPCYAYNEIKENIGINYMEIMVV